MGFRVWGLGFRVSCLTCTQCFVSKSLNSANDDSSGKKSRIDTSKVSSNMPAKADVLSGVKPASTVICSALYLWSSKDVTHECLHTRGARARVRVQQLLRDGLLLLAVWAAASGED